MLQRRVPQRNGVQGSPAFQGFGNGCKRFDPKVKIINWALEHDVVPRYREGVSRTQSNVEMVSEEEHALSTMLTSGSAAWRTPGQENEQDSSTHAEQASLRDGDGFGPGSPRERLQHTPGERLRTSHSRKRTPWAAMSYDGVSEREEKHAISAMDLAALQLRGEGQYTPAERRQLASGGICGWDAGPVATHPAMADARQTHRQHSTARQAAERPGPVPSTARHTHTANPVQQVCMGVGSSLGCSI